MTKEKIEAKSATVTAGVATKKKKAVPTVTALKTLLVESQRKKKQRPAGTKKSVIELAEKIITSATTDDAGRTSETTKKRKPIQARVMAAKIKKAQESDEPVLPKAPVDLIVRELALEFNPKHRMTRGALFVIREALEARLIHVCGKVHRATEHAKRNTIQKKDFKFFEEVIDDGTIPVVEP